MKRAAEHYRLVTENRTLIETLTESNRIKTQFLHGMSHEIRTPLGHITGFAEILESTLTGLTDKQERYLHNIGLANNLTQRLNGCITLKSAPCEGSTFTLVIPVSLS